VSLPAQQYSAMRAMLRGALAGNNPLAANPSDGEVLGFFKQLFTDASGAAALTPLKQGAMAAAACRLLSGNFAGIANPNDADVVTFWGQVNTDAAAAATLTAQRYLALRAVLRDVFSINYPGVSNPSEADMLGYFGVFASVSTPLTIITSVTPKLWLDSQLGAGANQWTDQSASGFNATEATNPPTLTTIGTVPCYAGNGVNQLFTLAGMTLTFGNWYWMIAQIISPWTANSSFCGGSAGAAATFFQDGGGASPAVSIFNGGVVDQNPTAMTVGSWFRVMFQFTNSAADYLQVGAPGNKVTGTAGGLTGTGWNLFARANANFGKVAIAQVVACNGEPTGTEKSNLDAWFQAKPFGGVVGF
jgi:hypothetical protein